MQTTIIPSLARLTEVLESCDGSRRYCHDGCRRRSKPLSSDILPFHLQGPPALCSHDPKPNGNLGKYVLPALVRAGSDITLITRHLDKANELVDSLIKSEAIPPSANIKVVQGDYSSSTILASSLKGYDSVISLLNRDQTAAQITVIDATIKSGVPHIVPAAFGVDSRLPEIRALPHLAQGYMKSENHLFRAIEESKGRTTYTIIHNGMFVEWAFQWDLAVNLSGKGETDKPSMVFDDGNTKLSASSMHDIGTAVATAVSNRYDERFQNKLLLMHNITFSQNELLEIAKDILPEKPWPIVRVDTVEAERKSQQAFDESGGKAPASAYHGFFARAFYGKGLGLFPKVDNELLGVEMRDREWLKGAMKGYLLG